MNPEIIHVIRQIGLFFGNNPSLPNIYVNKAPALSSISASEIICDNLNAMRAAREEFIKFESNEKVKRALRHNVRAADASEIENGAEVFYKRTNSHEWHGPGVVIDKDGKQFMVRHGGVYVRVRVKEFTRTSLCYVRVKL